MGFPLRREGNPGAVTLQSFLLINPAQLRPEDPLDEGSLTRLVAASIHCQPEQVDKYEPLHQSWGALFLGERNHRPVDRAMVVPLLLLCESTRSSSVVTLLRQDVTHHLTPIDRPDWSAEALVKHAQLSIGVPNPPGFHGPVVDQFQRPECQGQKHLDQQLFKPTNQPLYMARP